MWPFIYIIVALVMIYIIAISRANKKIKKEINRSKSIKVKLSKLNSFKATRRVIGLKGFYIFAIDETNKKIVFIEEFNTTVLNFSNIIRAEIVEDGNIISKTSIENKTGRSTTNLSLENGEDGSLGDSLNKATQKNKASTIFVEIFLKDVEASSLTITCFDARTMTAKNKKSIEREGNRESFVYKNGKMNAFQIKDIIDIALEEIAN